MDKCVDAVLLPYGDNISNENHEILDLGTIPAGFPSYGRDSVEDRFDLVRFLGSDATNVMLFRVSGDSMKDAGIMDGDFALVEKGKTAVIGDVVIAFVDKKYTIKYLQKNKQGKYYLKPANNAYSEIHPEESLEVFGVVKAIIRKIKS